jgi:hypothetical protein
MQQIYLDRDQCEQFQIAYFEKDSTCLRADVILASKSSGYDDQHTHFLQEFRSRTLMLSRLRDDSPGWYNVINTLGRDQ